MTHGMDTTAAHGSLWMIYGQILMFYKPVIPTNMIRIDTLDVFSRSSSYFSAEIRNTNAMKCSVFTFVCTGNELCVNNQYRLKSLVVIFQSLC